MWFIPSSRDDRPWASSWDAVLLNCRQAARDELCQLRCGERELPGEPVVKCIAVDPRNSAAALPLGVSLGLSEGTKWRLH
jgi:hypothetical protein